MCYWVSTAIYAVLDGDVARVLGGDIARLQEPTIITRNNDLHKWQYKRNKSLYMYVRL